MGDPSFLPAASNPIGLEVIVVGPVDRQSLHLIDCIAGELDRLPGMLGQVLADLTVQVVDAEQLVGDRPGGGGAAGVMDKS